MEYSYNRTISKDTKCTCCGQVDACAIRFKYVPEEYYRGHCHGVVIYGRDADGLDMKEYYCCTCQDNIGKPWLER